MDGLMKTAREVFQAQMNMAASYYAMMPRYERNPDEVRWHTIEDHEFGEDAILAVDDLLAFLQPHAGKQFKFRCYSYDDTVDEVTIEIGEERGFSAEERAKIIAENEVIRAENAAKAEAQERAEFERLQAKFNASPQAER